MKNATVKIIGRMKDTRILLGTGLRFEAGERVELYPADNIPDKGKFYATKIGGQDGILLTPDEFVEESRELVGTLD